MSLDIYFLENVCDKCGRGDEVECFNITHNLNAMADAAGIYGVLWCPEESGIKLSGDLILHLGPAIRQMKSDPDKFKEYNAPNGWGTYDHFVPWLESVLNFCVSNPGCSVNVDR